MLQWKESTSPIPYKTALHFMDQQVSGIINGTLPELVWLLQHPAIYTAGTSAKAEDLLHARFPVFHTGRGGQYTYHGPGQLIGYVMLDLAARRQKDIKSYVFSLEEWIINTLNHLSIKGERREGRVGIWVRQGKSEAKIAALGVRLRKWVTYHGIALNICPDLDHFQGIVPCGIHEYGVTSLAALGCFVEQADMHALLQKEFRAIFGD